MVAGYSFSSLRFHHRLKEHGGNLNEAVNAHFTEGDTNIHQTDVADPQEDFMDIDGPSEITNHRPPLSPSAPTIENVIETLPETRGTLSAVDDDDFPSLQSSHPSELSGSNEGQFGQTSHETNSTPSAPVISDLPDYVIEEEMIRAAIEASKHDEEVGASASSNERSGVGDSSVQDGTEDINSLPSGPTEQQNIDNNNHVDNENEFPSNNWGRISSEEHDEAVMLEAAMFGGISEGIGYRVRYARRRNMQNGYHRAVGPYPRPAPRPISPSLTAQRLIREQQDDEYLAALQADREKELLEMEEERRKEEEAQRKLEQEQEIERQLTAKEASLPQEPKSDDENSVTLLVRMPDGSRRGRRFMRTDKLQCLFDFVDVGRVVKPSTYRLVRPYPRRAFGDEESNLTMNELGLSSKQEALFLELI